VLGNDELAIPLDRTPIPICRIAVSPPKYYTTSDILCIGGLLGDEFASYRPTVYAVISYVLSGAYIFIVHMYNIYLPMRYLRLCTLMNIIGVL